MPFTAFRGRPCPDWFTGAGFGIFIHWGMYAIPAFAPRGQAIHDLMRTHYDHMNAYLPYAEWYQNAAQLEGSPTQAYHRKHFADAPYADFRKPFDAASQNFDAEAWADLFARAGAKYVVFVTKHHDGYCLWPTSVPHPRGMNWHSKRDFVGELADAVRKRGLRFGLYYSGGLDWSIRAQPAANLGEVFACVPTEDDYCAYAQHQVFELIDRYKPSVLWNDIAWPRKSDVAGIFSHYYNRVPDGVVNDRWLAEETLFNGLRDPQFCRQFNAMIKTRIAAASGPVENAPPPHCDFRTIEYGIGAVPTGKKWEVCRGLGLAFGYNAQELPEDYMSGSALIQMHDEIRSQGGNLLINVGPKADASIPKEQTAPLLALGAHLHA